MTQEAEASWTAPVAPTAAPTQEVKPKKEKKTKAPKEPAAPKEPKAPRAKKEYVSGKFGPFKNREIIKLLSSAADAKLRAGSKREAMLAAVYAVDNTDQVIGTKVTVERGEYAIGGDNLSTMIKRGFISLSPVQAPAPVEPAAPTE